MNISSLLSPDTPRGRMAARRRDRHLHHHTGPELYSSTPSDVPIQAPSPIHPLNQAALWENGEYDLESVEKAMSKSSSSSSAIAGYYDPIHDQDSSQFTMPVQSPGGRRLGISRSMGAYDPVHSSSMASSSHLHTVSTPSLEAAPSPPHYHHHPSQQTGAPLAPPPIPYSAATLTTLPSRTPPSRSPPPSQRQPQSPTQSYQHYQQHTKAAYPNVLNEVPSTDSYSSATKYTPEKDFEPAKLGRHHYDPIEEIVAQHQEAIMREEERRKRLRRVWQDDIDEEHEQNAQLAPHVPQGGSYDATMSENETKHDTEHHEEETQPKSELMDEDVGHEMSSELVNKQEDGDRIQELRILLERYPLYKPAHLEIIALLRRRYQRVGTKAAWSELESVRNYTSETMQLGEEAWIEWIQDEDKVCADLVGRVKIIDLCSKSVEEQPMSVALWNIYVTQLEDQYRQGLRKAMQDTTSPEDAEMDDGLSEIFTQEILFGVYEQAVEATKYHISESHVIWDRYLSLLSEDLEAEYSESKVEKYRNALLTRLKTPHSNIDSVFSTYSSFVTKYENVNYEKIMVSTNKLYSQSKAKYEEREMHELQLKRAIEAVTEIGTEENAALEWQAWKSYLDWELGLPKKKQDLELACALFGRCIMRYDYRGESMWDWYLDYLAEKANRSPRILLVLGRAVHAFPALPSLWSRYLITMEAHSKSFEEMEHVKNKAIDTVSKVGEEALLQVCYTWAGMSKRRILQQHVTASEEEKAILMEEIKEYMKEFRDLDPEARLERLYIALCMQLNTPDFDSARKTWKGVIANGHRARLSKLWLNYFQWEFQYGTRQAAGTILRHACSKAATIDDPNAIFEAYNAYVAEWGDISDVEELNWKMRRWKEKVPQTFLVQQKIKQAAEAEQQAAAVAPVVEVSATAEDQTSAHKRRRSVIDPEYGSPPPKKNKPSIENLASAAAQSTEEEALALKRDREHSTVVVRNLPLEIKELRLRQFFRDCGKINSLKIVPDSNKNAATATIEFENRDDVLSAQTKDMKSIDGHEIEVQIGNGLTVYVTNFPPSADEEYIRNLFQEFGEIVDIRFPSLKYNTHRRFCYIQFLSQEQAQAALSLHGKKLGPKEKLLVKISNPLQRQERSGAVYEGREIFIRNIDFKASEADVKELFEREVGNVETVRLPSKVPGRHQGFGFVVFAGKEAAEKAVELSGVKLMERALNVTLSSSSGKKLGSGTGQVRAVTPVNGGAATESREGRGSGDGASPVPGESKPPPPPPLEVIKRKTVAVMNLPDTVNDTRLRELFEKYGPLRKVQLRPNHQGAIVEFMEVKDAGKAGLALEGYKFPEAQEGIRIGRLEDLMRQPSVDKMKAEEERRARQKREKKGKQKEEKEKAMEGVKTTFAAPMQALRNAVAMRGRGKRGGLGFVGGMVRRSGAGGTGEKEKAEGEKDGVKGEKKEEAPAKGKSNADFKALFLK
ncbi:hypothetical protein BDZ91DRAFT_850889 [Kalaharituber pfeilii]|nr:hypothetical protein BDZ91DRAFT_850889 [Kalaharituber pfeilii]